MSADRFGISLDFVLKHECVFAPGHDGDLDYAVAENVPGDSGGITKFGIDQSSHPHINIGMLTLDQATAIYHDEEWTKCRCDDLPAGFDTAVFDAAVNCGMGTSIKWLQRALNVEGGAFLTLDGQIGPKTLLAASALQTIEAIPVLKKLLTIREQYYSDLAATPARHKFAQGWSNRVTDLAALLGLNRKGAA